MMRAFTNQNKYNDNTSGVATVLTIIDNLSPEEFKNVAFILFDNEEKGKKGSAAYFKDHKSAMQDKFLINFDCVGNGENIIFIAQKNAVDSNEYHTLKDSFTKDSNFDLDFCTYKDGESNSDHKNFPRGVACIACKKSKKGILYTPRIHTSKDIVANNGNVDFLAKNTVNFITKIS
jgi:Zn-dependent M28 family amino/carboxypeptidase